MIITKKLGDSINYSDYNAIVYLLRKFKKLKTTLQLGAYELTSDFGDFTFTKGFENIGNNFILNNDVSVTSSNVLKNTFYTFIFSVLDVNLSGIVNKRNVKITGSTGEDGALELNINESLIDDNEVIMPNFDVEIVFDEHEYYTPLIGINFDLSVNKRIILQGESCVITGILTNNDGEPLKNRPIPLSIGNYVRWLVTDTEGKISHTYAGTGEKGKIIVSAYGESVFFYDGVDMYVNATVSGDSIKLGYHPYSPQNDWLHTDTNVIIDWGDGTVDTVFNPLDPLIHQYNDGLSEHVIVFDDIDILGFRTFSRCTGLTSVNIPNTVTSIGGSCFGGCTSLTSINIPDSVASIGSNCFDSCSNLKSVNISNNVTLLPSQCFFACTNLESIEIPASVTGIGGGCFTNCRSLKSYDLNWENNPVTYSTNKYKVFAGTVFYIPYGTTDIYVDAGYPSDKLVEKESPFLFNPALDGTDNITSWTSLTNKTEDGVFTSHGSFLTDGWSNDALWQLDFDYRYTDTRYIGLMPICVSNINPFTDGKRDAYALTSWEGGFPFSSGKVSWSESPSSWTKPSQTAWNHVTVKKTSDTGIEIILNDTYKWVGTLSVLPNWDILHIGSRDNPSDRNAGGSILYKNIEVKRI